MRFERITRWHEGEEVLMRLEPDEPHKQVLVSESDVIALKLLVETLPKPWDGNAGASWLCKYPDREKMLLKESIESILTQCDRQEFKR